MELNMTLRNISVQVEGMKQGMCGGLCSCHSMGISCACVCVCVCVCVCACMCIRMYIITTTIIHHHHHHHHHHHCHHWKWTFICRPFWRCLRNLMYVGDYSEVHVYGALVSDMSSRFSPTRIHLSTLSCFSLWISSSFHLIITWLLNHLPSLIIQVLCCLEQCAGRIPLFQHRWWWQYTYAWCCRRSQLCRYW